MSTSKLSVGMRIEDNDPRNGIDQQGARRNGTIKKVNSKRATVEWNTGRTTEVAVERIGVKTRTGYTILSGA